MNNLVPLHFEQSNIRMVMLEGVPWWVLVDVAQLLDLSNPTKLAARLEDYQKAALTIREGSSGQGRRMNIVNEAGVYALTLNSRKPQARVFAKWLFAEVLPSIRRWGQYPAPEIEASEWHSYGEGARKSMPERFREERLRWEQENPGYVLADIPSLSPSIVRAIESGMGGLYRGRRIEMLTKAGIDTQYVMIGRYTVTPPERRMIARSRAMQAQHRLEASVAVHEIEGPEA